MAESEVLALIKRLEAVTARLEKLERQIQSVPETTVSASASNVPTGGDSSASVREFDELVNTSLKAYFDAAAKLGGEVNEQVVTPLNSFFSMRTSVCGKSHRSVCKNQTHAYTYMQEHLT